MADGATPLWQRQLETCAKDLLDLERIEEALVERAITARPHVMRRPSASPLAVRGGRPPRRDGPRDFEGTRTALVSPKHRELVLEAPRSAGASSEDGGPGS